MYGVLHRSSMDRKVGMMLSSKMNLPNILLSSLTDSLQHSIELCHRDSSWLQLAVVTSEDGLDDMWWPYLVVFLQEHGNGIVYIDLLYILYTYIDFRIGLWQSTGMFLAFGPSFSLFSSMDFLHVRDTGYFFLTFTTENEAMSQSVIGPRNHS